MQADGQTENWCGVLQEVALPCQPEGFLEAAVAFANDRYTAGMKGDEKRV